MKRELTWHDISACLSAGVMPEVVRPRDDDQVWHICHSPITELAQAEWATVLSGDMMRIPLVPYRCAGNLESLVGAALELGMYIPTHVRNAVSVLVVVGTPVEQVSAGEWRVWIGLTYRTR